MVSDSLAVTVWGTSPLKKFEFAVLALSGRVPLVSGGMSGFSGPQHTAPAASSLDVPANAC